MLEETLYVSDSHGANKVVQGNSAGIAFIAVPVILLCGVLAYLLVRWKAKWLK